ncbi:MAG: DUF4070 domain-containing protein [Bacteroidota bacterium]|nr:DUF4070 domain-containing protein [Bacteroidota bacterium]
MNVLLVYPQYPDSFWSFKNIMKFISKKATVPPLGLITVSAMLPKTWKKKLVDMNVSALLPADLIWVDYVFISAMHIQQESVDKIIDLCLKYEVKIIAGGSLFTQEYMKYPQIDHFILNEAEITMPLFLKDLNAGKTPEKVYRTDHHADITLTPLPDFNLLSMKDYVTSTFVGIETPDEKSLQECNKGQNNNRDLLHSVKKIQNAGLQVSGGFIVGFDTDTASVFQKQIDFIQQSGIVSAMVGLLNAPKNTVLYNRLKAENRLTSESSGNNTDTSMNFIPVMNRQELLDGYKSIIQNIYATKPYYKRIRRFLLNYRQIYKQKKKMEFSYLVSFFKSLFVIGIVSKGRGEYWKLLIWTLFRRPALLKDALTFAVYGYHFRTVYGISNTNSN